jgi:hypothetical protein
MELADKEKESAALMADADTVALAEILTPGLANCENLRDKSLNVFYATHDGKKVIDGLLRGKAFDSADKDLIFASCAEIVKHQRNKNLTDAKPDNVLNFKVMDADAINKINEQRFGKY